MARTNKSAKDTLNEKRKATIDGYERLIGRLKNERKTLEDQVNRDYYDARQYVRSNPEEGVLVSFLGGIALGYILGKIGQK